MARSRLVKCVMAALATAASTAALADPVPLIISQSRSNGSSLTLSATDSSQTPGATQSTDIDVHFATGISQFDSAQGVLTGVSLTTAFDYTSTASLGTPSGGSGTQRTATLAGQGTATYGIPFAGGTAAQTRSISCRSQGGTGLPACPNGGTLSTGPATIFGAGGTTDVDATFLGSYLGGGTYDVTRIVTASATATVSRGYTLATGRYDFTVGPGTLSVDYKYLEHANGAFGGGQPVLTLDFGTVTRGATIGPLGFQIANLGGMSATGLDLDEVVASGDSGTLGIDASGFTNLAAGGAQAFFASLDTSQIGQFAASYRFLLSDADIGVGQRMSEITLHLMGNVESNVPEPASLALLGLGLAGLAARRRRFR